MAVDWDAPGSPDEPIPLQQLQSEVELLALVQFWRERYERLADEKNLRIKRWCKSVAAQNKPE